MPEALHILKQGARLTRNGAYCLLQECEGRKNLECGRHVQSLMAHNGLDSIAILGDHLIRLFAYHGILFEANKISDRISAPNAYTWTAIILANAKLGNSEEALELYQRIGFLPIKINNHIYISVLKACTMGNALAQGRIIHDQILRSEFQSDVFVGSSLLDMYVKCGSMEEACKAFCSMQCHDVVSWSAMISGFVQLGDPLLALQSFDDMQEEGVSPDALTFAGIMNACAIIGTITQGRGINVQILEYGLESDLVVGNTLLDMYAKCGSMEEACRVLRKMGNPDVVSWSTMISGYAQNGEGHLALKCLERMQLQGINPNEITLSSIAKACAAIGAAQQGRLIHGTIIQRSVQSCTIIANVLMDMYAKCGYHEEAYKIFDRMPNRDVVSWNIMIIQNAQVGSALECFEKMQQEGIKPTVMSWGATMLACVQHGESILALQCFDKMQEDGIQPSETIFSSALKACTCLTAIEQGRLIHEQMVNCGIQSDIVENTLIDMYAKCGSPEEAKLVFNEKSNWNVVSWNAMICGYVQHGKGLLALQCFDEHQEADTKSDCTTFQILLKACASVGALGQGRYIHEKVMQQGFFVSTGNGLIDMYVKSGSLIEACGVFENLLHDRDTVSWGVMIAGHAQHGEAFLALECFQKMQREGLEPNEMVFASILIACSHAALVEEGCWVFNFMSDYNVSPDPAHYACVIDLLSRAGYLTATSVNYHLSYSNICLTER